MTATTTTIRYGGKFFSLTLGGRPATWKYTGRINGSLRMEHVPHSANQGRPLPDQFVSREQVEAMEHR